MSKHILATAIDFGAHTVKIAVFECQGSSQRLRSRGEANARGVAKGFIVNKSEALASLKEPLAKIERQLGEKIERAWVSVSGKSLQSFKSAAMVVTTLGSGEVSNLDIEKAVERAEKKILQNNQRAIEHVILKYKLDGVETVGSPVGLKGKKLELECLFFTAAVNFLDAAEEVLDRLDITVGGFMPHPLASGAICLNEVERKAGCVLVNIGSDTTTYTVFEEEVPIFSDAIEFGSSSVVSALALGLKITMGEAEALNKDTNALPGIKTEKVTKIKEKAYNTLFKTIAKNLKAIGKEGMLPAGVVLCGGGSAGTEVLDAARSECNMPSRHAQIGLVKKDSPEEELGWAGVYGLGVCAIEKELEFSKNAFARMSERIGLSFRRFFV